MDEPLLSSQRKDSHEDATSEEGPVAPNKWLELGKLFLAVLLGVFLFYQIILLAMYIATHSTSGSAMHLWQQFFPTSIEDVDKLAKLLLEIQAQFPYHIFMLVISFYTWKQMFAVPGSALLNVLAGVLYGPIYGALLVCSFTALGSSLCYLLSRYLGGGFLVHFVIGSSRIAALASSVQRHRSALFFYCLFIRLFPFTPNWLFNITAPWLNIPLSIFFTSVLLGCIPYNIICTQAGSILTSIHSMSDIMTPGILLKLLAMALMALLPAFLREKYFKNLKEEELSKLKQ